VDDPGNARLEPGRVIQAAGSSFRLVTASGERQATPAGRLKHEAAAAADMPAVGDWVMSRPAGGSDALIERVLPRRTKLSRKVPGGRSQEQVVAANVDIVLVVMGLDGDFSPRRIERYLTLVRESGARPAVLLNKVDLCPDPPGRRAEIEAVTIGAPVLLLSCTTGEGVESVRGLIGSRETAVLVGSSGAGKSTLINRLLGSAIQKTAVVREDDGRGRHTTTHRELFRLPGGGLLIDNPGIREVQLWASEESLARTFDDIAGLAVACRYRDCSHETEPGCAVLAAAESGDLPPSRLEGFRKLQRELRYLHLRQNESAQRIQRKKWRAIHREIRRSFKTRRR
jgi:ribosome biogenesis GTPase